MTGKRPFAGVTQNMLHHVIALLHFNSTKRTPKLPTRKFYWFISILQKNKINWRKFPDLRNISQKNMNSRFPLRLCLFDTSILLVYTIKADFWDFCFHGNKVQTFFWYDMKPVLGTNFYLVWSCFPNNDIKKNHACKEISRFYYFISTWFWTLLQYFRTWRLRVPLCENDLWQIGHLYGFSPLCVRICSIIFFLMFIVRGQYGHP